MRSLVTELLYPHRCLFMDGSFSLYVSVIVLHVHLIQLVEVFILCTFSVCKFTVFAFI